MINGKPERRTASFDGVQSNWVISNYSTGFYAMNGNDDIKVWNGNQKTPNHRQTDPSLYINNDSQKYWIGYINHGMNPIDSEYEYLVIPEATTAIMSNLDNNIKNGGKPYVVHQKNADAHIIQHNSGIWGYVIFNQSKSLNNKGIIVKVSEPCMIMYEEEKRGKEILLSVVNPALGFANERAEAVEKELNLSIKGRWVLSDKDENEISLNYYGENTLLKFITKDGLPHEISLKKDTSKKQ